MLGQDAEQRRSIPSLDPLATVLLVQPRLARSHCLLPGVMGAVPAHVHSITHQYPQNSVRKRMASPQGCSQSSHPPSLHQQRGLCQPRGRTSHLALLNFTRFTGAHPSSLSSHLLEEHHPIHTTAPVCKATTTITSATFSSATLAITSRSGTAFINCSASPPADSKSSAR